MRGAQDVDAMRPLTPEAGSSSCGWPAQQRRAAAAARPAAAAGLAQLPQELLCSILELVLADDQEQRRRRVVWLAAGAAAARAGQPPRSWPLHYHGLYPGQRRRFTPAERLPLLWPLLPQAGGAVHWACISGRLPRNRLPLGGA